MTVAPSAEAAVAVLAPEIVRFGAVVSYTVTVKVLSPLMPALSVAEQVTVVVPSGTPCRRPCCRWRSVTRPRRPWR